MNNTKIKLLVFPTIIGVLLLLSNMIYAGEYKELNDNSISTRKSYIQYSAPQYSNYIDNNNIVKVNGGAETYSEDDMDNRNYRRKNDGRGKKANRVMLPSTLSHGSISDTESADLQNIYNSLQELEAENIALFDLLTVTNTAGTTNKLSNRDYAEKRGQRSGGLIEYIANAYDISLETPVIDSTKYEGNDINQMLILVSDNTINLINELQSTYANTNADAEDIKASYVITQGKQLRRLSQLVQIMIREGASPSEDALALLNKNNTELIAYHSELLEKIGTQSSMFNDYDRKNNYTKFSKKRS